MKSVDQETTLRQYLSYLPTNILADIIWNYRNQKICDLDLVKFFITAKLSKWDSYREMADGLAANPELQQLLGINSFSPSQFSRRLRDLNTYHLADLFHRIADTYWRFQKNRSGPLERVGMLSIIDGTHIKVPVQTMKWAAISKDSAGVKMHVKVAVANANSIYPEKVMMSTGNISDIEMVNHLVTDNDTLYVMDRGYGHKTKMGGWLERGIDFVVRVQYKFTFETLISYAPQHPQVLRNEKVSMKTHKKPLRYIEFVDDKGSVYHLMTSRLDLTEQEVLDVYKSRWQVELFFKWIKQHVKFDHILSFSPTGIWNQLYISLITYALAEIMHVAEASDKTTWSFFRKIRTFLFRSIHSLREWLLRVKKPSRGRQKITVRTEKKIDYGGFAVAVRPLSKEHFESKKSQRNTKS
ncbi:IS4 family transposase [Chryseomicrobium sp. FSL W7-1435]|uniref:IS4 family transposase n=1 Tax=Chryseomicrobium sp. FSL W7-1435 TaxID=2921704 RepID=UPI00315B2026